MQYALAFLALVATVSAQTKTGTPPSCSTDFPGLFQIVNKNVSSNPTPTTDRVACTSIPLITLKGGVMTDQVLRTAEIVANHQFQFDTPLQDPRFFTAGFSVCQNNTLALGDSAIFWGCNSGSFSNIYDQSLGGQCYQIYLEVNACDSVNLPSSETVSFAGTSLGVGAGAATFASAPPSTSATISATSAATSASSAPSTSAATSATSVAPTTAAITSSLAGPAIPSVAPFPKGNSTTPAGTASATAPGHATTSATTSALTAPASGASATIVGSTFGLVAAALVAFAMF